MKLDRLKNTNPARSLSLRTIRPAIGVSIFALFLAQPWAFAHQETLENAAPLAAEEDALEDPVTTKPPVPSQDERLIVLFGTNDIHGGVQGFKKEFPGGMETLAIIKEATQKGLQTKYGKNAGILTLDAGDQFQGTLISNYDEGQLVFKLMNAIGYDAAIPGNHDYDFGPMDWRRDSIGDDTKDFDDLPDTCRSSFPTAAAGARASAPDMDPRGALKRLVKLKKFAFLSANTYLKKSIQDSSGKSLEASGNGCRVKNDDVVDWSKAKRPDFLETHKIFKVAGARVAVIGLDNPMTPSTTNPDNVSDLCFRSSYDTYMELQQSLTKEADVFVLVIHDGNVKNDSHLTQLVDKIIENSGRIDAVIAGHTHHPNRKFRSGVPIVQSNADGKFFGRVDLIWDSKSKKVLKDRTWAMNSIPLNTIGCDARAADFCTVTGTGADKKLSFEGALAAERNPVIQKLLAEADHCVSPIATIPLGEATAYVKRARDTENPLSNHVADAFREATGADIAIVNGGGLRADLFKGPVTYADLYRVIPFNNRAWVLGPVTTQQLVTLFKISAQSCGARGSLFQSGIVVEYSRDCKRAREQIDSQAQIEQIRVGDRVIYDRAQPDKTVDETFMVATLDFLGKGGSGYKPFETYPKPPEHDRGVLRELLRKKFQQDRFEWSDAIDSRFKNRVIGGDPVRSPVRSIAPATESPSTVPPLPHPEEWSDWQI